MENKKLYLFLFVFCLLLLCALGVLQAEEQWYLISEAELQSIEQYKATSEQEKQSWLSQVQALKQDSASLNSQLAQAREQNIQLEQSFNKYESDQLTLVSTKNGEIADLKQDKADLTLRATKAESTATLRLVIIIGLTAVIVLYVGFKIYRKARA